MTTLVRNDKRYKVNQHKHKMRVGLSVSSVFCARAGSTMGETRRHTEKLFEKIMSRMVSLVRGSISMETRDNGNLLRNLTFANES